MVMFRALDTNGDGVVTEEEFLAPHEQRFDAMDTNGDGRLTPEEFTTAGPPPGFATPLQQRR
jgi:Ca2+-binding EF-hand superfamily protein